MASSLQIVRSLEMGIFFPVNLIGNLLVIIVIKRTKKNLRTPVNYLLGNLAVADITVAFFMVVDQVFFHTANHPGGLTGDYHWKDPLLGRVRGFRMYTFSYSFREVI